MGREKTVALPHLVRNGARVGFVGDLTLTGGPYPRKSDAFKGIGGQAGAPSWGLGYKNEVFVGALTPSWGLGAPALYTPPL